MTIRRLTAQDQDFLRKMQYEALYVPDGGTPFPEKVLDEAHIARYFKDWGRSGDFGFVAIEGHEKVGAVWCRLFPQEYPGYGFVADNIPELSIAVLEEFGAGLGIALIKHALSDAQKKGAPGISLSVDARNIALNWYLKLGFNVVSTKGNPVMLLALS